jgi:hypothetical protein
MTRFTGGQTFIAAPRLAMLREMEESPGPAPTREIVRDVSPRSEQSASCTCPVNEIATITDRQQAGKRKLALPSLVAMTLRSCLHDEQPLRT